MYQHDLLRIDKRQNSPASKRIAQIGKSPRNLLVPLQTSPSIARLGKGSNLDIDKIPMTAPSSTQLSHRNRGQVSEEAMLLPKTKTKLKQTNLDRGTDALYDDAMDKLDMIFKRTAQKEDGLGDAKSPEKESKLTAAGIRNIKIIERVQKLKHDRGMVSKSKESKFEEKMVVFKDVKTFIDIKNVVKDMRPSDEIKKSAQSAGLPDAYQFGRRDSNNLYSAQIKGVHSAERISLKKSRNYSPLSDCSSMSVLSARFRQKVSSSTTKRGRTRERTNESRSKEGRKKSIEDIDDSDEELNPDLLQRIKARTSLKRHSRRIGSKQPATANTKQEVEEELKDFEVFNSLLDFLSKKEVEKGEMEYEVGKDGFDKTFYKRLWLTLFNEEKSQEKLWEKLRKDALTARLIQEQEALYKEANERRKLNQNDNQTQGDEPIRILTDLNSYRKRCEKIIKMLKNKSAKLNEDTKIKLRKEMVESHLQALTRLNTQESAAGNHTMLANQNDENGQEHGNKSIKEEIGGSVSRTLSKDKVNILPIIDTDRAKKQDPTKTYETKNFNIFEEKPADIARRFVHLRSPDERKKNYYLGGSAESARSGRRKREDNRYIESIDIINSDHKRGKKLQKIGSSFRRLYGDISNELEDNKELTEEIKQSQAKVEKFYDKKTKECIDDDVPECLKLPRKRSTLQTRTNLIMDITRNMLKGS